MIDSFKRLLILICILIIYNPLQGLAAGTAPEDVEHAAERLRAQQYQIQYKDYIFTFYEYPDVPRHDELTIVQNGRELFSEMGTINLLSAENLKTIDLKATEDIKNINYPFIIVKTSPEGAHCPYCLSIIQLEPKFKILGQFDESYTEMKIEKLLEPMNFRIKLTDFYGYTLGSYIPAPLPEVIIHFNRDKSSVAIDEMRKKPLTNQELNEIINDIKAQDYSAFKYTTGGISLDELNDVSHKYFEKSLQTVFDLIYSGRSLQAREIIDKTWPGDEESKLSFISAIQEILKVREYYDSLVTLNSPYNILEKLEK